MKVMRKFFLLLVLSLLLLANSCFAKDDLPGKQIFYTAKGKFGTCNYCHANGASAGRFDPATGAISEDEGRKIPSLKGIGKKKDLEQIQRSVDSMRKMFGFKLTEEQIKQLTDYVSTL